MEGQDAVPVRNAVYGELFGNGLYASVNYERRITPDFTARVGATPFGSLLLMLNHVPDQRPHSAELGFGLLAFAGENFFGTATVGYRYQPRSGGTIFRVGWTPLIGPEGKIAAWAGASIGTAF